MKKYIGYALAGIGALWIWDRYRTARDAGVPISQAIKSPFSGVKALVMKAAQAADRSIGGRPTLPPPQQTVQRPQQQPEPQYPTDSDDVLIPDWIYSGEGDN